MDLAVAGASKANQKVPILAAEKSEWLGSRTCFVDLCRVRGEPKQVSGSDLVAGSCSLAIPRRIKIRLSEREAFGEPINQLVQLMFLPVSSR